MQKLLFNVAEALAMDKVLQRYNFFQQFTHCAMRQQSVLRSSLNTLHWDFGIDFKPQKSWQSLSGISTANTEV